MPPHFGHINQVVVYVAASVVTHTHTHTHTHDYHNPLACAEA